ncbi:hypothetical protein I4U23_022338 [Adineta vaga]|nr:hypothetical protein I4U23_022338 [Adineta vaga]
MLSSYKNIFKSFELLKRYSVFVSPQTFGTPCTQDLDITILSLRESGEFDNLKVKWFQVKLCRDDIQTTTAKEIQSMSGLFLIFAILTGLALVVFMCKKRRLFKRYLFTLGRRKNFFFKTKNYAMNGSNQTPNVSISSPARVQVSVT